MLEGRFLDRGDFKAPSSWLRELNGAKGVEQSDPMSNVARLIEKLLGNTSSPHEEETITARLLVLARSRKDARLVIGSHSRAMPLFISILKRGTPAAKVNVTATVSILSKDEDLRMKVFLGGCIPALLSLLKTDSDEVRKAAAEAIYGVSCGRFADNHIVIKIFLTEGVIPTLLDQLSLKDTEHNKVVESYVTGALRNLCGQKDDYRRETISAGGMDIIMRLLSSDNTASQSNAASLLARIMPAIKGRMRKVLDPGAVKNLLRLLYEDDVSVRVSAADALEALCSNSTEAMKSVVEAGGIHVLIGAVVAPSENCNNGDYGQAVQKYSTSALASICGGFPSLILYLAELANFPRSATTVADIIGALAYCLMGFEDKSALKEEPFNVKWVEHILAMLLKTQENKLTQDRVIEALAILYSNSYLSRWLNHAEAKKILIGLVTIVAAEVQKHLVVSLISLCLDEAGLWVALKGKEGVQLLISFLGLSSEQHQQLSAQLLAVLVNEIDDSKGVIAAAGGIPPLVQLLETGPQKTREAAGDILSNLSYHSADICAFVQNAGAVPAFLRLLRDSGSKGQEVSAKALKKLVNTADSATLDQIRAMLLGDFPLSKEHIITLLGYLLTMATHNDLVQSGAMANTTLKSLVEILHDSSEETRELAASVLADIFDARKDICSSLATDEIVKPCMKLLASKKHSFSANSARAISSLSWHSRQKSSGKMKFVPVGEVKPLIRLAKISFLHAAEAAVAALANLLSDSEIAAEAVSEDVVTALARVLSEGSSEGKKNASRAFRLLLKHCPSGIIFKEKPQFHNVVFLLLESLKSPDMDDSGTLEILGIISLLSRPNESTSITYPLWSTIVEVPSSWEPVLSCLAEGTYLVQDKAIEIISRLCEDQPVVLANILIAKSKVVSCIANKIVTSSNLEARVGAASILICVAKEQKQQTMALLDMSGYLKLLICALSDMMKQNYFFCSPEVEARTPRATSSTEAEESETPDPVTVLGGTVSLWLLSIIASCNEKNKHYIMDAGVVEALSEKLMDFISEKQGEGEDFGGAWIIAMLLAILFQDVSVVNTPTTMRIIPLLALLVKSDQMIDKYFAAQALASLVCNGNKAVLLTIANSGAISGLIAMIGCIDSGTPNLIALLNEFSLVMDPDQVVLMRLFEIHDVKIGLISRKAIPLLVDYLRLMPDRPVAPPTAVNLLIQIAEDCDINKFIIAETGALEALPKYLLLCPQESTQASIAELLRLLFSNADVVRHRAAPDSLNQLITILQVGSRNARQSAAQALRYLFEVDYIRDSEAAKRAIQPLVDLLNIISAGEQEAVLGALLKLTTGVSTQGALLDNADGNFLGSVYKILSSSPSMELKKVAAQLCCTMFENPRVRSLPLATKCIEPLIILMESRDDSVVEAGVCAFEKLLDDGQQVEFALGYEIVSLLVGLISGSNYRLIEASIKTLLKLGKDRTPRKVDMVKAGAISNCLALLLATPSSLCSTILELFRILTNSGAIARSTAATRIVEPLFTLLHYPDLSMLGQHTALQALLNVLEKPRNLASLNLNSSQVLEPLIRLLDSPYQAIQQLSTELLSHILVHDNFQKDAITKNAVVPLVQLTGTLISSLQRTAVRSLEKISALWPKEIAEAGGVYELSRIIMQDDPKAPDSSLWESAALILSNILHLEYYFEVPMAVLVKMLHSSNLSTVEAALDALIALERLDAHSVALMAEAHAVEALLDLLLSHQCEEAAGRLLEALFNNASVREMDVSKYAVAPLSQYLLDRESRSKSGKLLAALALGDLSQHGGIARSSESIFACRALISLLVDQPTLQTQMVAICALQNFVANSRTNRRAVVESGGIIVVQKQLISPDLEVAVQASLLVRFLFSTHELQEYASNDLIASLTAALERELWSPNSISEEVCRTIHVLFSNFPKLQVSGAATSCLSHLARALNFGTEAVQESILDTLYLVKHSWPTMPTDIAKLQEEAAAEAIPSLQMLIKTRPRSFHERAESLLSCLPGCLIATIHRGSNLKQSSSYTSAYCQLNMGVLPPRQTKAVRFSNFPEWKEPFAWAFDVPPKGQSLHIVCKGKSTFGKSTLGRVDIQIDKVINEGSHTEFYKLISHHKEGSRALEVELNWSNRPPDDMQRKELLHSNDSQCWSRSAH